MNESLIINLMVLYGIFLFGSAIAAFVFIGSKAKTALMSGGMSGTFSLIVAYGVNSGIKGFAIAGPILCLILFFVFAWRSYKSLDVLIELIRLNGGDIRAKAIAFLIISMMAIISLALAIILFALVA